MPSEKVPFYDPIPPTYDEAVAGASRYDPADWSPAPRTPINEPNAPQHESQSLLHRRGASGSSSRRQDGYRPPTVETDDDDSLFGSDDDSDDEAAEVRREMQEMEVEEPGHQSRGSLWAKRIPFSLSLPSWKWSWRPRLPRLRIRLPQRVEPVPTDDTEAGATTDDAEPPASRRRWCRWPEIDRTVAIIMTARILVVVIMMGFGYLLIMSDVFLPGRISGLAFNPEDVRLHVLRMVEPDRLRASVQHFSRYAHIAGTEGDYGTALDVESMFVRAGLDKVSLDEYGVYLNYPTKDGRAVQIMDPKDAKKAIWSAKLDEDKVGGQTIGHQTYAFHGHSKSGDVTGPLVYANYGSREDFALLKKKGIKTKGAIALVRYYGTQTDRALKVKAAEMAGFSGCLIYSDPADDGFLKGDVAPKGPYMPADGVQRGSVSLMNYVIGDVLSPGFPSKKNGQARWKPSEAIGLNKIPSLPLAWRDAQVLLQHIKGHGEKVPSGWQGGVPDVEWWTGDSSSPMVRLKNQQDEVNEQPIWNVYGKIIGTEQGAKSIILGNHRDAWSFGATDPHSGTAIMIELARIFGDMVSKGWRPLRTIEFMSWDAEEYNLIGSTEFVENNDDALRKNAYAYINLDTAVVGSKLRASGSPVFAKSLRKALGRVTDPHHNLTLSELWAQRGSKLEGLGAGSDYVAFQDIVGTSSLDLSFEGSSHPYHSAYDNFQLVENVIDPGFTYHAMLAQLVGLILLDLASAPILPFDMSAYGDGLDTWVRELEKWAAKKTGKAGSKSHVSFKELNDAVSMVQRNAKEFERWEERWVSIVPANNYYETAEISAARFSYNDAMANFETALLDLDPGGGIPNRTQFKHVVFGPQLWSGYDEAFFPAIRDLIEAGEWDTARRFVARTAALLRYAASLLSVTM